MNNATYVTNPVRSSFVSIVGWIFIVLSGFAFVTSLFQLFVVWFIFPGDEFFMDQTLNDPLPVMSRFIFENFKGIVFALFVLSMTALMASVALLRRREWGRKLFIGMLIGLIVWQIGGLISGWFFVSSINAEFDLAQDEFGTHFQTMQFVMLFFNAVIALACSVLFGWMIKRLQSQSIRAEFS